MKKQIIILTLTFCLLLTSCSDRQISSSSQQEIQQSDVVEHSKVELSENVLSSLRNYVVTFAGFYDRPFSSTAELDYESIGRNSLLLIATGENSENFETDSYGYPYVEKELLQEYVFEHFGIENYEYPVSDNPNILPQYDESRNAYLTGIAGDGPRSKITIQQNVIVSDENITYTVNLETPNIETGAIMETRDLEYKFEIVSKDDGYILKAISATEQSESDVSSEKTKCVIMGIAGNNAQGIDVKIDIPENWDVGVEEITEDGHFIARFGIASKCTSDADEAIDIRLAAEEGSDVVIKEIDGAKNIVKYCKTKVEMYTDNGGWITMSELDGVRYSFGSGKLVCDIFFAAEEGADLDQERAKFEACLKTLEIIS